MPHRSSAVLGLLLSAGCSLALNLDLNDANSIKAAGKSIVENIVSIYGNPAEPGFIPGTFPLPYYWWEGGLAFDSLVNYWALTGDETYNELTRAALSWQVGASDNYLPANQTKQEGNDDQATWGLAAMTAAERNFPAPNGNLSWLQLAENVFNSQALRWDTATCDGGLRWQIYSFNAGYDYKNAQSNGNLAQLAARLGRFTGNQTYGDWAQAAVKWSMDVGLLTDAGAVYDGSSTTDNCSTINHIQWTASAGTYLAASAFMSNTSAGFPGWIGIVDSVVAQSNRVFALTSSGSQAGVLTETACAPQDNCDVDQLAFRAILARALANVNALATEASNTTMSTVSSLLRNSAMGAAAQCSGGANGTLCGNDWANSTWDGTTGLGQDLSALEIILANLPAATIPSYGSAAPNSSAASNGTSTVLAAPSNASGAAGPSDTPNAASTMAPTALLSLLGLACAMLL